MAATVSYSFAPGAIAAATATALPADAPKFWRVTSVLVRTGASGGTASTTSPAQATVEQTLPAGGVTGSEFYLDAADQQWQYGTATTDGTTFTIIGFPYGSLGMTA